MVADRFLKVGLIRPEWLRAMGESGVELVQSLHPFSYVVWASSEKAASVASSTASPWARTSTSSIWTCPAITISTWRRWPSFTPCRPSRQMPAPGGETSNQSVIGGLDDTGTIFSGYADWLSSAGFNGSGGNDDGGIYIERQMSDQNRIQRNIMYANLPFGIVFLEDHKTDPVGTGPNNMQVAPEMTSTSQEDGIVSITYSVPDQVDNFPLAIEFFLADGSSEQGRLFLIEHAYPASGSTTLTFNSTQIDAGEFLVATATDSLGNTSEFSASSEVLGDPPVGEGVIFQDRFQ